MLLEVRAPPALVSAPGLPTLVRVLQLDEVSLSVVLVGGRPGGNCIKIGLPGKLILSKRKGLREVLFS